MATMISSEMDVVNFLKDQHEQIKELFVAVANARGAEREAAFHSLRRLLAVHEAAEEEVVHPAARLTLANGETIVEARLHEEHEAKTLLVALERLDVGSTQFAMKFSFLEASVLAHADAEEREEFARLGPCLGPRRLERMRAAAKFAEAVAPLRPRPGVEAVSASLLPGPFHSMLDRARDVLAGKP